MMSALNGIINIMVVLVILWYIFAILAVQFFGGTTYSCNDESMWGVNALLYVVVITL